MDPEKVDSESNDGHAVSASKCPRISEHRCVRDYTNLRKLRQELVNERQAWAGSEEGPKGVWRSISMHQGLGVLRDRRRGWLAGTVRSLR